MDSLKSEVLLLLEKLVTRYNDLPDGPLHPLDADLILSSIRELYIKTEALRNFPPVEIRVSSEPSQEIHPFPAQPEPAHHQPVEIPLIIPGGFPPEAVPPGHEPQTGFKPVGPKPENIMPATEAKPTVVNEFNAENEFTRDSGPTANKSLPGSLDLFGTPTIADKLKTDTPSLNDKITSGKNDLSLADRIQLKPISDLRAAIGLNEKFQFINELFEGSTERYTEAVNLLNSCAGSGEADQLYSDLKSRYNWDEQKPVIKKLHEFIIRRYL
ncbi:MAG: hypothetical protein V1775_12200 [Bacteroidota bacterium]